MDKPQNQINQTGEDEELLMFNVMPKVKSDGQLIETNLKTKIATGRLSSVAPKKILKLIFVLLAVAALAASVYFAYTKFKNRQASQEQTSLSLEQTAPSQTGEPSTQSQAFSTAQEWRNSYFPNCQEVTICGDDADPDRDGLTNLQEFNLTSDPNNPDSDQDGLSDGDEVNVFSTNPLKAKTNDDPTYTDADYVKGGYDITNDKPMTPVQIEQITNKMKQSGLHQPTITTLGTILIIRYNFTDWQTQDASSGQNSTDASLSGIDFSPEAKQDRDAQRTNTIKNISIALIKYSEDLKIFPKTNSFSEMTSSIKPYIKVALNPVDPINRGDYIYTYAANELGDDFTLTFYSETQNQLIKVRKAEALKYKTAEEAALYDDRRKTDLDTLRTALLLYSRNNATNDQVYVFPTQEQYKSALVPNYISSIPKDPKTGQDYEYQVGATFNTFTLKTVFDNPPSGTTGYLCNQEECRAY